jgi:hypothetical protein
MKNGVFERIVIDARHSDARVVAVYLTMGPQGGPDEDLHFLESKPTLDEAVHWAITYMDLTGITGDPKIITADPDSQLVEEVTAFLKKIAGDSNEGEGDSGRDPF